MNAHQQCLRRLNVYTCVKKHAQVANRQFCVQKLKESFNLILNDSNPTFFPHYFNPYRFEKGVPRGFWNNEDAQRDALERIGRERFGVEKLDDWYGVSSTDVALELSFIGKHYKNSLFTTLSHLYPQHNWDPSRFAHVPQKYWNKETTQREALERLGRERFGVKELNDWYSVPTNSVYDELTFIKSHYKGSLYNTLKHLYPQHDWNPASFVHVPRGYWRDERHQRAAIERIGREHFGVKQLDDWYAVSSTDVINKLSFIKLYYNSSLSSALKTLYPNHNWVLEKFSKSQVPRGYWKDIRAQRDALEKLGRERFGVKELDDWYNVSSIDVSKELSFLKNHYNSSLYTALVKLYPRHDWNPVRFSVSPRGYWKKTKKDSNMDLQQMLNKMIAKHDIKTLSDWRDLPPEEFRIFNKISNKLFGGKTKLMRTWYPHQSWADDISSSHPERSLRILRQLAAPLFSHANICGYSVDIYLPKFLLAIEYQGEQHFKPVCFGSYKHVLRRDTEKKLELAQQGIQLVSIPYWWKGSWSHLLATILRHCAT